MAPSEGAAERATAVGGDHDDSLLGDVSSACIFFFSPNTFRIAPSPYDPQCQRARLQRRGQPRTFRRLCWRFWLRPCTPHDGQGLQPQRSGVIARRSPRCQPVSLLPIRCPTSSDARRAPHSSHNSSSRLTCKSAPARPRRARRRCCSIAPHSSSATSSGARKAPSCCASRRQEAVRVRKSRPLPSSKPHHLLLLVSGPPLHR